MYLPLDQMKDNSRVWIYTANRAFTESESKQIQDAFHKFTSGWMSHGKEVKGSYEIRHDRFIVVAADDSEIPSGCSVDSMFAIIKQLEQELNAGLLDRQLLSFLIDTKIIQFSFSSIKKELNRIENTDKKIFFNNLVADLDQFNREWLVEPHSSWIKTYL